MNQIDDYGLRHLVEHLIRGEMLKDALAIIEPTLREEKRKRLGSDVGFVHDLELIIDSLERSGQLDGLPPTIRCSVIHSLLTSLTHHLPPEVLSAVVCFGEAERAVELATPSPEGEEKVAQLLAIANSIRQSGANSELALRILREAFGITQNLRRVAEGTQDSLKMEIAQEAAHLDWDWCQRVLGQIQNANIQTKARIFVAAQLARDEGKVSGLLRPVLPTVTAGSFFLFDLARALGQVAQYHLETAHNLIESVRETRCQDIIRREASRHLLEHGHSRLALAIAERIRNTADLLTVIGNIAGQLAEHDLEEAVRLLHDLPASEKDARVILGFIEALQPKNADCAYNAANRIVESDKKCLGLTKAALLFAKVGDVTTAKEILKEANSIARQQPLSDIIEVFLVQAISETIAAVLLASEDEVQGIFLEWDILAGREDHIKSQMCHLLLDSDAELVLKIGDSIGHPYLKGVVLARVIFHLEFDDPQIPVLQEQVARLAQNDSLSPNQVRHLQAYLLVSKRLGAPEHLLSLWQDESELDARPTKLQSGIVIGRQPANGSPNNDKLRERDEMLVELALDASRKDVEQALIVLQAVPDSHRCSRGLVKLADHLNRQFVDGNSRPLDYQRLFLPAHKLYEPIGQLARHDRQLALRIIQAMPNQAEQAKACAMVALTLRDGHLEQGRAFLENALALGQIRPGTSLKTIAYLELDECIPADNRQIDLIQKAISSLPTGSIPTALPQLNKHLVTHLVRKGEIEKALQIAEEMTATHLILDTPEKASALLEIAESAIKQGRVSLSQEILDEALNMIRMSAFALPALPRLASLIHQFDPEQAKELFNVTVECAMDREMSMHRAQILHRVVHFQVPYDIQTALEAARKIPDPCQQADALLTAVTRGDLSVDEAVNIVREAEELLAADSSNPLAKGWALLKLVELDLSRQSNPLELIREAVHTVRQTQPADWYQRIALLIQAHHHCEQLGAQNFAREILSETLEVARNDPFEQSFGMVQAARLLLAHDVDRAVAILHEILQRARLEGYDAIWKAITAIIPITCELGGTALAKRIYDELDITEGFFTNSVK